MKHLILNSLLILIMMAVSCDTGNEERDVTAPVLEITDPANREFYVAGGDLHIEGVLTDDFELAEFQVDVHHNFDGHGHGRVTGTQDDPNLMRWSFKQSFPVPAGRKNYDIHLHDDILIPANTMAGPYHLIISAVDKSGNATSYQDDSTVELEIFIQNNSQAKINITNLHDGELEIEVGEVFMVEGSIWDDVPASGIYSGIESVEIALTEPHEADHNHNHNHGRIQNGDGVLAEMDIDGDDLDLYMDGGMMSLELISAAMNFTLSAQEAAELATEDVDHLELMIVVKDKQGNYSVSFTPVHIHAD